MSFEFASMTVKYQRFTGKEWRDGMVDNDVNYIKKNFPMVSLERNEQLLDKMHMVRDWCQEQFGDDWIYDWNDFYFVREQDATLFALRWQ